MDQLGMSLEARDQLRKIQAQKVQAGRNHSMKNYQKNLKKSFLNNIQHREECYRCELNCVVNRDSIRDFWAVVEGLETTYTYKTCPKITDDNLKMKRKAIRRARGKVK